jgi:hypothetical protein
MSVAKCLTCGHTSRNASPYRLIVEPAGYPDCGLVCGTSGCEKPALVWLMAWEANEYRDGRRVFSLSGRAPKVRLGDTTHAVPAQPLRRASRGIGTNRGSDDGKPALAC